MKNSRSDGERFARYQAVLYTLLGQDSFLKGQAYEALQEEEPVFIGRVIADLVRDGYLNKDGKKSKPSYSWTEKRNDFNPGRWIDQRVFTAAVKRSPRSDRPRERLLAIGPGKLKTSELLAILIRAGQHGESATQAAEKLAAWFGDDLQTLSLKARGELKQISRAIGETAYCQIMAALELGKRMAGQEKTGSAADKITSTADALSYCARRFRRLAEEATKEEFHVVILDQKHQVIRTEQVTVGLVNKSLAHPREIFRPAIRESASAIILVHNHPSGDPVPSEEDKAITRDLKKAGEILGVRILDHIIVAKGKVLSMVDEKVF